jgi:hypothetical protein
MVANAMNIEHLKIKKRLHTGVLRYTIYISRGEMQPFAQETGTYEEVFNISTIKKKGGKNAGAGNFG